MACERNPGWCQPPVAKPIVLFLRRMMSALAIIPYCGIWYRKILGRIYQILCLLQCLGESYGGEITVTDELTTVRAVDRLARKTYLANTGLYKATIFENGALIRFLYPGECMESPTQGRLEITAICATGQSTTLVVTTEKRCDCDVTISYYEETIEPIGGPLI